MASVYVGRHTERAFRRPVALKVVFPHLTRDEAFVDMFLDEAGIASTIQSPHVVRTLDVSRDEDGTLSMAMDLVIGGSLRELLGAAPLPTDVALSILRDLAYGLRDTHVAAGPAGEPLEIVHRDVSPHNVLVGLDGVAKLADFGIARAVGRISRTETGQLKGKMAYLSPEQIRSQPVDARSDLFAFGAVAWEALVGEQLFPVDNPLAAVRKITMEPIPSIADHADLPDEVVAFIDACLEREPADRLSSVEAAARLEEMPEALFASRARVGAHVSSVLEARLEALQRRLHAAFADERGRAEGPEEGGREDEGGAPQEHAIVDTKPPRPRRALLPVVFVASLALLAAWGLHWVLGSDAPSSGLRSSGLVDEATVEPAAVAAPAAVAPPAREPEPSDPSSRLDGPPSEVSTAPEPTRSTTPRAASRRRPRAPEPVVAPSTPAESPPPARPGVRLLGRDHFDRVLEGD